MAQNWAKTITTKMKTTEIIQFFIKYIVNDYVYVEKIS